MRRAMPLRPQPIALDARVDTKTAAVVDRAVEMRARRSTRFVATYLHYAEAPEHVIERVLAGAQARRQPR